MLILYTSGLSFKIWGNDCGGGLWRKSSSCWAIELKAVLHKASSLDVDSNLYLLNIFLVGQRCSTQHIVLVLNVGDTGSKHEVKNTIFPAHINPSRLRFMIYVREGLIDWTSLYPPYSRRLSPIQNQFSNESFVAFHCGEPRNPGGFSLCKTRSIISNDVLLCWV